MGSGALTEPLRETLALFEQRGVPQTTSEVADVLDVGRRSTYERLDRLVDGGHLDTKKVGANGRVWWRSRSSPGVGPGDGVDGRGPAARRSGDGVDGTGPAARRSSDGVDRPGDSPDGTGARPRGEPPGSSRGPPGALRSPVDAVETYAVAVLGPAGHVRTWNEGARRITGYRREAVLGEHVSTFYTAPDREDGVPDGILERAATEGVATDEGWLVRADGSRFWAHVTFTALTDGAGDPRGFVAVTRDATERRERERRLERKREELTALDNLNDVVRDITEAVIDRSSREEIEAIVCDRLAAADSYEFAWVGEVDPRTGSITPRQESGVEGYLESVTLTTDPEHPGGRGPAGRAVRTGKMQVARNSSEGWDWGSWRACAEEYGFESTAVIPVVHGDTLYALLGVYADRRGAFGGKEWDVVAQLGEVVGHAIAAVERKRALTSDELTEVEFTVPGVLPPGTAVEGSVTFDRAVPAGDGQFLQYGTVETGAIEALEAFADRTDHFEEARVFGRGDDRVRFELRATDPPVASTVASHGGYVDRARVADGDLHVTVHLPPTVAARRILAAVRETYPDAEFLTRRQFVPDDTRVTFYRGVTEGLTDRQRATLEAAVHAGYFEWPRDSTGEEVARSLDVAPPTFHQHLRKAQRTVFEELFRTGDRDRRPRERE